MELYYKACGETNKKLRKKHVNKKIRNMKKQTKDFCSCLCIKMFAQFVTNMKIMNITWTLI